MSPKVVLFDLDGVIRHFDSARVLGVEIEHGLEAGSLDAAAFEPTLLHAVVTGQISRAAWVVAVGESVGCMAAAQQRLADTGTVDEEMMDLVDTLRSADVTAAVLTNGTDTIPDEMKQLGLTGRFSRIFSTSDIGFAKPDQRAFRHVCDQMQVDPVEVFFTDDSERNLSSAVALGMDARLFEGVDVLKSQLADVGLL